MLVILVIPYIFTMITSHGFQDYVTEYLPDFTISAGTLHMDDTFWYNSGDVYVYADSSTEYFEEDMVHILPGKRDTVKLPCLPVPISSCIPTAVCRAAAIMA